MVDDEPLLLFIVDRERPEVRRVSTERGPRFFTGRRIGGEARPDFRLDVHAHVPGVGVDDVAVRVEVRRRQPFSRLGVFGLGHDELVGPDEPRPIVGGRRRWRRRALTGQDATAEHDRREHNCCKYQYCREAPGHPAHDAPPGFRAAAATDESPVAEAYHHRVRRSRQFWIGPVPAFCAITGAFKRTL